MLIGVFHVSIEIDKVYGKLIQDEFKTRYLYPIKKRRDDVYFLLNTREDLQLA